MLKGRCKAIQVNIVYAITIAAPQPKDIQGGSVVVNKADIDIGLAIKLMPLFWLTCSWRRR